MIEQKDAIACSLDDPENISNEGLTRVICVLARKQIEIIYKIVIRKRVILNY
jgi:hypothetical protein